MTALTQRAMRGTSIKYSVDLKALAFTTPFFSTAGSTFWMDSFSSTVEVKYEDSRYETLIYQATGTPSKPMTTLFME